MHGCMGTHSSIGFGDPIKPKNSEEECLTANAACTKSLHILECISVFFTDNSVTDDRELNH